MPASLGFPGREKGSRGDAFQLIERAHLTAVGQRAIVVGVGRVARRCSLELVEVKTFRWYLGETMTFNSSFCNIMTLS